MRDLVDGFISQSLSRRNFVQSLAAIGVSAAGIAATVRSAEAVTTGAFASAPSPLAAKSPVRAASCWWNR